MKIKVSRFFAILFLRRDFFRLTRKSGAPWLSKLSGPFLKAAVRLHLVLTATLLFMKPLTAFAAVLIALTFAACDGNRSRTDSPENATPVSSPDYATSPAPTTTPLTAP